MVLKDYGRLAFQGIGIMVVFKGFRKKKLTDIGLVWFSFRISG